MLIKWRGEYSAIIPRMWAAIKGNVEQRCNTFLLGISHGNFFHCETAGSQTNSI
jgi:hypothetical protein